ncbi:DUF2147 domain-containing protein [Yoonia sp. SS1-5]|uniref:DUF2147 domain-containing protein n=1 Tax=Yoonia rhodophyticola TaxID=3137370 RepID=A0AAN0MC13_9RHOB
MKKILMTAAAALCMAGTAMADPLEGIWQTAKDDNGNFGFIQVAPCGAALCGTLIKSFDSNANEISSNFTGRNIISETVANGGGAYSGKVYSPDRDKTYSSKLQLNGDQLSVSGCVLGICRNGGTWVRVQ